MTRTNFNRRRFMQLGAAGIAATAFAGSSTMVFGQGPKTVRFAFWGPDARVRIMQRLAEDFTNRNPDISIALEFGTIENHRTKLTVGLASRDLPDVAWITGELLPQLASSGSLVDLSQYYGDLIDNSEFEPAVTAFGNVDGGQYLLTHALQSVALFANTRILEEAGVPVVGYPDAYTWDEFAAHAQKIHEVHGPNFWGTDDPSYVNSMNHFRAFARQNGEELWSPEGPDIGYSRETLTKWLTYWENMRATGAALPASRHLEAAPAFDGSPMIRKLTGFHNRNSNQLLELSRLTEDKIALLPVPGNGGEGNVNVGLDPNTLGVAANAPNLEEALRFANYLMTDTERAKIMGTTIGAPSIARLRADIAPTLSEPEREFVDFINYEASVDLKPVPAVPDAGNAYNSEMQKAIESMAYELATVEETVDTIFNSIRPKHFPDAA